MAEAEKVSGISEISNAAKNGQQEAANEEQFDDAIQSAQTQNVTNPDDTDGTSFKAPELTKPDAIVVGVTLPGNVVGERLGGFALQPFPEFQDDSIIPSIDTPTFFMSNPERRTGPGNAVSALNTETGEFEVGLGGLSTPRLQAIGENSAVFYNARVGTPVTKNPDGTFTISANVGFINSTVADRALNRAIDGIAVGSRIGLAVGAGAADLAAGGPSGEALAAYALGSARIEAFQEFAKNNTTGQLGLAWRGEVRLNSNGIVESFSLGGEETYTLDNFNEDFVQGALGDFAGSSSEPATMEQYNLDSAHVKQLETEFEQEFGYSIDVPMDEIPVEDRTPELVQEKFNKLMEISELRNDLVRDARELGLPMPGQQRPSQEEISISSDLVARQQQLTDLEKQLEELETAPADINFYSDRISLNAQIAEVEQQIQDLETELESFPSATAGIINETPRLEFDVDINNNVFARHIDSGKYYNVEQKSDGSFGLGDELAETPQTVHRPEARPHFFTPEARPENFTDYASAREMGYSHDVASYISFQRQYNPNEVRTNEELASEYYGVSDSNANFSANFVDNPDLALSLARANGDTRPAQEILAESYLNQNGVGFSEGAADRLAEARLSGDTRPAEDIVEEYETYKDDVINPDSVIGQRDYEMFANPGESQWDFSVRQEQQSNDILGGIGGLFSSGDEKTESTTETKDDKTETTTNTKTDDVYGPTRPDDTSSNTKADDDDGTSADDRAEREEREDRERSEARAENGASDHHY